MRHLIVVLSGLAGDPHEALDDRTPLAAAATPTLDRLAATGELGLVQPLPEREADDPALGCDDTTLALLGYEPVGPLRGAVEVIGAEGQLDRRAVGVRFDLIHSAATIDPFPAPPTPEQAQRLWADLERLLSREDLAPRAVSPLRGLGIWANGPVEVLATPPGQLVLDQPLDDQLPQGEGEALLHRLIDHSRELLAGHAVNRERTEAGLPTLDAVWPWGFSRAPDLPLFMLRTGQVAVVLSDNLAARGVARAAGVSAPRRVADTGHERVHRIVTALDHAPTVVVHLSAIDHAAHTGDPERTRDAIAGLDHELLGPLARWLDQQRDVAFTVLGDYATRCATRGHAARAVPYVTQRPGARCAGPDRFSEATAAETGRCRYGATDLRGWLWSH